MSSVTFKYIIISSHHLTYIMSQIEKCRSLQIEILYEDKKLMKLK